MKRWISVGIACAVLAVVVGSVVLLPRKSPPQTTVNDSVDRQETPVSTDPATESTTPAAGRYTDYSQQKLSTKGYDTTILFFHAPWCVECRGFEKAITSGEVPAGVQILKVDYDSSVDLRKQYGVTIQSTFVRVNSGGEKQATWVGYGKDKSVDAIIKNTQ